MGGYAIEYQCYSHIIPLVVKFTFFKIFKKQTAFQFGVFYFPNTTRGMKKPGQFWGQLFKRTPISFKVLWKCENIIIYSTLPLATFLALGLYSLPPSPTPLSGLFMASKPLKHFHYRWSWQPCHKIHKLSARQIKNCFTVCTIAYLCLMCFPAFRFLNYEFVSSFSFS